MPARTRELRYNLTADSRGLRRGVNQSERELRGLERTTGRTARRMVGNMARIAGTAGIAAVGLGLANAARQGIGFEKQMSRVRAVTGANAREMRGLTELANRMGAETKFSSSEAASAMYELAAAGTDVNHIGSTLRGTLALAAASNIELARASEITSKTLNAFELPAGKATYVADVLARTVNASSAEMEDLAESMKYVAPVAASNGQSFEEMAAALAIMSNRGVEGSQAGTSLAGALTRMVNPSKQAQKGLETLGLSAGDLRGPNGLRPLGEIIEIIETRTKGMDTATRNAALAQVFGQEAQRGMLPLLQAGSDALEKQTEANKGARGTAERTAKVMQDNVAGAWEQLTGSIETAGIALYSSFQEPMKDTLSAVTDAVNAASGDLSDFFETVSQDPKFKGGDLVDKFEVIVDELDRRNVGEKIGGVIVKGTKGAITKGVPALAEIFLKAFMESPMWARALGTAWLLRKLGGRRKAAAAGAAMGSSFASGFAGTAGPVGVVGAGGRGAPGGRGAAAGRGAGAGLGPVVISGGRGGAAGRDRGRRGTGRGSIANQQRGRGWENWRPGAPTSQFGPQQGRVGGAIGRGLGAIRGAGAAGLAAFGGPAGVAAATVIIAGPKLVQMARPGKTEGFGLPSRSGYEKFMGGIPGMQGLRNTLGGADTRQRDRLTRFGDKAEGRLAALSRRGDLGGLSNLAAEARRMAKEFPESAKQLSIFANAADDARQKFAVVSRGFRKVRINPDDIIDPQAHQAVAGNLADMSRNGVSSVRELRRRMDDNAKGIKRAFTVNSRSAKEAMVANFGAGIQSLRKGMKDGTISTDDGMKEIRRITRKQMRFARDHMGSLSLQGKRALARNFEAAADAVKKQMDRGKVSTREGMREIYRLMAASLRAYGVKVGGADIGKVAAGAIEAAMPDKKKAQGGWIGSPGERGRDAIPAMLGRGEFVANAHQQRHIEEALAVSQALGVGRFGSLDSLAGSVQTPHYLAKGGFVQGASARGLTAPALSLAHKLFSRGFNVTSAYRSTSGTYHGRGMALDLGDSVNDMRRLGSVLIPKRGQFAELFGPGGSWKHGRRIPQVPNHKDHWHAAVTGGVGGLGAGADRIKRVKIRSDLGLVSKVGQGAVDRARRAAQKYLDEKVMAAPTGAHGAGQAAGNRQVRRWAAQALRYTGKYSPANLNALVSRIMQESGGNPRITQKVQDINSRRGDPAVGLAQVIGSTFARYRDKRLPNDRRHPLANLVAAINYMYGRYGRIMGATGRGYQSGGRVGALSRALRVTPARARQLLRRTLKPADLRRLNITEPKARELGLRLDPISFRYQTYSTAMRRAGEGAEVIERASDRVGFLERQHGLTEEDLMLPSGREERLTELGAITTAQQEITKTRETQFGRLNNASVAARKALNAARAMDRRLLKEIKAAKEGSKERKRLVKRREQVRQRMRRLEGHRKEALTAREEAERALRDARLDVDETAKAIAEVNSPVNVAQGQLELVELQEAAGNLSAAQAFQLRFAARQAAMDSGKLSQRDYLTMYTAQREDIASQRVDPLQAVSDRLAEIDLHLRAGDYGQDAAAERTAQAERDRVLQETLNRADLTTQERLSLRADLKDLTKAIEADKQARDEHAQAVKDLADTNKQILAFAQKSQSIELGVVRNAMADIISGQLASNYGHRARAAGNGSVAR